MDLYIKYYAFGEVNGVGSCKNAPSREVDDQVTREGSKK
jgi:hypothetical protein